jgi:NADH:ubiquinone oxidoreductase subunit 5 (subunit L)/multisubunit Na+/H+ antiporter MnhA subunit
MPDQLIVLVPLLPLLASLWIAIGYAFAGNRGEAGEKSTARIALFASVLSLLLILVIDLHAVIFGAPGQVLLGEWFAAGNYRFNISFMLDPLGLAMATLVAFVVLLTMRFSVNYLHREAGFQRFFMVLGLFGAAMLLIVTAGNALLMFVGWELAGVSSYLLIAYSFDRPVASNNATRAFITNRIGDMGFILALYLGFSIFSSVEWAQMLDVTKTPEGLGIGMMMGCFVIAAMAKSGLVPFAPWISRALEGPTSSSAIFYGSLMVHAGVYLVIRLEPLMFQIPAVMLFLVLVGVVTAMYGFLGGLVQTDAKSSLMFSTTGQVGLMFLACGLGWFELAAWHLAAHALWRAYQFLSAPALMQLTHRPARPVPDWLRRKRWLYTASIQRFWLDNLADSLLVRPTRSLAHEIESFDDQVVNRLIGLPTSANAVSSLADWEAHKRGTLLVESDIGTGRGIPGSIMEWFAQGLQWFEEHLILRSGGEGLFKVIGHLGRRVQQVENLLERPRYLWLMVLATFVIII